MSADVESLLDQLGSREWEVARTLDWAGVTGRRRSTSSCPVANFLRLYYPDAFDVTITPTSVRVWEQRAFMPTISWQMETPPAVRCFLSSFDEGTYPRLDEELDLFGLETCREAHSADPGRLVEPSIDLRVPV